MTLIKYIFKKFLPVFFGALIFFSMVLILVDLLMNLWQFIQNEVAVKDVGRIMLYYIPKTLWYAVPLAILFASSFTLSNLYAGNELEALFSCGVSLFRFTLPMLIFSFIMSFALFFFENKVVVPTYSKKVTLQNTVLGVEKSMNNDRIVILSDQGRIIYKANEYLDKQKRLYDLTLVFRNDDKSLKSVIFAQSATWSSDEGRWILTRGQQFNHDGKTLIKSECQEELLARIDEPYETFRNNTVSIEEVNTTEAKAYIAHLQRAGLPHDEELSVYYKKFSFPFIVFIVVFLSIGLTGKTKKNVLLVSLASSISAAVLFYVTQMVTMLLAKFGYITAFSGAWIPVILFTILSIILLRYSRT